MIQIHIKKIFTPYFFSDKFTLKIFPHKKHFFYTEFVTIFLPHQKHFFLILFSVKNRRGQTVLHITVERRVDRATEYLIGQCDANPQEPDNTGKTPLDYAANAPQYQGELKGTKSMYTSLISIFRVYIF